MHDPRAAGRPIAVLVHPSKRLPVRCHRNVSRDLNRSRLEIDGFKPLLVWAVIQSVMWSL